MNSQDACLQGEWQEPPPAPPACRHGLGGKYREEMPSLADDGLTPATARSPRGTQKKRGGDGMTQGMTFLGWWGRGDSASQQGTVQRGHRESLVVFPQLEAEKGFPIVSPAHTHTHTHLWQGQK